MNLLVNGMPHACEEGTTLAALMDAMQVDRRYLAASINCEFVPRSTYATRTLREGDHLELLSPRQGG